MATQHSDIVVIGGGLAGIVAALELLRAGQRVTLVDRDTPERFGGLALWAFGGMALVGTPLQAKMKIPDTPERALADWLRFGELDADDHWPRAWARHYVEHSRAQVHDWLLQEGVKFMPAVNWVERGLNGEGNSLPRYHIVWGTSRELTRCLIAALRRAQVGQRQAPRQVVGDDGAVFQRITGAGDHAARHPSVVEAQVGEKVLDDVAQAGVLGAGVLAVLQHVDRRAGVAAAAHQTDADVGATDVCRDEGVVRPAAGLCRQWIGNGDHTSPHMSAAGTPHPDGA